MDGPRSKEPAGRTTSDGYGIKADERYYLKLNPDSLGPQHDEHEPRFKWAEGLREIQPEAILHSSVLKRFVAEAGVQHYYETAPYRPGNLSRHLKLTAYYAAPPPSEEPH
ncbi:hypothetical protein [Bradyrhizobium diazoefficiens]|uniref:hypothetical protein n=1 Tax=Bradyrhizobium diazoefficiens TaxID=1355477 RepID=UPI003481A520